MIKPPDFDSLYGPYAWDAVVAANAGDVAALRRATALDPKLIKSDGWDRPKLLPFAVQEGHMGAVRFLLEAGVEPDLVETAKERGYFEIAALLEEARARWRRVVPSEEKTDHPIHRAAEAGDLKGVRDFLDADPSLVRRSDRSGGRPCIVPSLDVPAESRNSCSIAEQTSTRFTEPALVPAAVTHLRTFKPSTLRFGADQGECARHSGGWPGTA